MPEPDSSNPLSPKVRQLEAKVARLEKELATARDSGSTGTSCRAAGIQPQRREGLLMAAKSLASPVGVAPTCRAVGVSRATIYRRHRMAPGRQQPRPTPARVLCEAERKRVLNTLASPGASTRNDSSMEPRSPRYSPKGSGSNRRPRLRQRGLLSKSQPLVSQCP